MVLGAVLGFGGSIGSGLISAASSSHAAKKAFNYNRQLIQMQQDWQERMSNTAHQREVDDLRKAGLNPILSATGGSGASFGSASAPGMSVQPADFGDLGISSALAIRQQKNQNKMTESQTALNEELKRKTGAEWSLVQEQEKNAYQEGLNLIDQGEILKQNIRKATAEATSAETFANLYEEILRTDIENKKAVTKYTNERARGFSSSRSYSSNSGDSSGSTGFLYGLFPGVNSAKSFGESRSYSRNY